MKKSFSAKHYIVSNIVQNQIGYLFEGIKSMSCTYCRLKRDNLQLGLPPITWNLALDVSVIGIWSSVVKQIYDAQIVAVYTVS